MTCTTGRHLLLLLRDTLDAKPYRDIDCDFSTIAGLIHPAACDSVQDFVEMPPVFGCGAVLRVLQRIVVSAVPRCVRTGCLTMAAATTRGDVAGTVPHVRRRAVELRHVARHCVRRPQISKSEAFNKLATVAASY